jgi:hypothetical protein
VNHRFITGTVQFDVKFVRQRIVKFLYFDRPVSIGFTLGSFTQQAGTLQTGPRTQSENRSSDIAHRREAFHRWIDPTIQRHIGRAHKRRLMGCWVIHELVWRLPYRAAKFRVVTPPENIL